MPKLALLVTTFIFFVFLLQQNSSGIFEDFEQMGTDSDLKLESDLISTNLSGANLSGANLLLSYSKNAIISDIKISTTTKSDACFDNELFDRILCNALRKLESDSPPFYGEYRNYHRDDLF